MLKVTVFSAALLAGSCMVYGQAQQDPTGTLRPGQGQSTMAPKPDANGPATQPSDAERYASLTDDQFVKEAASCGMTEVRLGQLAQDNASNADVKTFGQHMVADHSKGNDDLKAASAKANIAVPADIDAKGQKHIDHLQNVKGDDFDRQYIRMMVWDHRHTIQLFQAEADRGQNADLKAFASATLPTLHDHLKMAEETAGKMNVNVAGRDNPDDNAQQAGERIPGNQGGSNGGSNANPNDKGVVQPETPTPGK